MVFCSICVLLKLIRPHTSSMEPIVFKKMVHIQIAGGKHWMVETETVDGVDFVEVHMKDLGFSRFVTGTTTGIRGMQFMSELRTMRNTATASVTGCSPGTEVMESMKSKYVINQMKRQSIAENGMPTVVDVHLPAIIHGETHVPARIMKLKASIDEGASIVVELNESNMQYIKMAMIAGGTKPTTKNKPSEPTGVTCNVWWRAERNAFVACRSCSSTAKQMYKTFKVGPLRMVSPPYEIVLYSG